MKLPTQSKCFYQISLAIAMVTVAIAIWEPSLARPRGNGSFGNSNFGAPSRVGGGNNQFSRPSRVEPSDRSSWQIPQPSRQTQATQAAPSAAQFQQRVQEIKANSQFQQRVQEIKANPQFQQRVQEIQQNIQANPEAAQTLADLQASRQQFKVERREDWQNYLNETRDDRQDNFYYYDPYYGNIAYGYDYFWGGYYPNYFVPLSGLSVSLFASDFDGYDYDSGRYYPHLDRSNYVSPKSDDRKISNLPEGFISIVLNSDTFYYYLGTFYIRDAATGNYAVTPAPVGAVVPYIPTEYQKVTINEAQYYHYAGIYYRPTFVKGQLLYEVVKV